MQFFNHSYQVPTIWQAFVVHSPTITQALFQASRIPQRTKLTKHHIEGYIPMGCCPAGSDYAVYAKSSKNEITSFRGVVVWITKAQYLCSQPHSGTEFSDDQQELTYAFCLPQAQLKFSPKNTTRKRMQLLKRTAGLRMKKLGYSPNMAITQFQHLNDGITFLLFFFCGSYCCLYLFEDL